MWQQSDKIQIIRTDKIERSRIGSRSDKKKKKKKRVEALSWYTVVIISNLTSKARAKIQYTFEYQN